MKENIKKLITHACSNRNPSFYIGETKKEDKNNKEGKSIVKDKVPEKKTVCVLTEFA